MTFIELTLTAHADNKPGKVQVNMKHVETFYPDTKNGGTIIQQPTGSYHALESYTEVCNLLHGGH